MHLAERAYVLVVLTAVLIVAGTWASDPAFAGLWRWPAALLLLGLAIEGYFARQLAIRADIETAARALLGRSNRRPTRLPTTPPAT
jgi:hypothetical protein